MAAEIKQEMNIDSKLIGGSGGVFDIHCNDDLIYSKQQQDNQFPESSLVLQRIAERKD